jgi:hypothetical protein
MSEKDKDDLEEEDTKVRTSRKEWISMKPK